ncbi:MAG: alpha-glucan family phosphorylase [Acidobacteria bacterium]|nr:MAG: alpha-glucan family phosphorylase [Acidobacteriota bacterium]
MEIGLRADMATYSGGLGVLAGDTLRAAADLGLPLVAVTLVYRRGYFRQHLDAVGAQTESPDSWNVADGLREMDPRVDVEIEGKTVRLRAWLQEIVGVLGQKVTVYFLDSDLEENDPASRALTDQLYGGDKRYRLSQEVVLGIGGVRMLHALGHDALETYHMNEGHSALLTLELMRRAAFDEGREELSEEDVFRVREGCVFTTHTPVAAGHDRFPLDLVRSVLGEVTWKRLEGLYAMTELNMTELALRHSRYVNGVARRHGDVTREMFDGYDVQAITNGVHAATWTSAPLSELFDRYVPGWREDNQSLRYMTYTALEEIEAAHRAAKKNLIDYVETANGIRLSEETFTIGFARRAAAYKRADLLFDDVERLKAIASKSGAIQIVYAGKAHPHDEPGKAIIRRIVEAGKSLGEHVVLVYLENYGIELGGLMTSGCDLWLNTPEPPKEASGTSGMKAALNGVPSLSILDGWWVEGHVEGVTGWSIGDTHPDRARDASELYDKLESKILPLYYDDRDGYSRVRRYAISINGSFFNTERMVSEYARQAYRHRGCA